MGKNYFRDFFDRRALFFEIPPPNLNGFLFFSHCFPSHADTLFCAHTKGTDDAVDAMYIFPNLFCYVIAF